jgi:hypothetical protein
LHASHAYTPSYPEPNFFCNISTGKNKTNSTSEEHTRNHIPKGLEKTKDYTNIPPWLQTYDPTDPRSLPAAAAATVSRNIRCTLA